MAIDKAVDSSVLNSGLTSIANAIRSKGGTSAQLSFPSGMKNAVDAIPTKQLVSWHQCPEAVRNYLAGVTYDTDYTYSHVQEYAPTPVVAANTKPIGKTVDGVTYYNEVPNEATPFVSTNAAGSLTPLDRVRWINSVTNNFRDLGGWECDGGTVRYGLLFRSGELNAADADLVKNQLGITTELDLTGDGIPGAITGLRHVGTSDGSYAMYALTPVEAWKINLRAVFDAAKYREPLVFHCSSGADRTGTLACVIEGILGVSQSDCDKDYELTSFCTERRRDRDYQGGGGADWRRLIGQITALTGSTFRDKCVNFAASLGFTAAEINAFRAAMIDGNPGTVTPAISTYTVTNTLTHAASNNPATSIDQYQSYEAEITPENGYVITDVQIRMGGTDITNQVWKGEPTPPPPEQSKTVTPTAAGLTVTPDAGKVLSSVVVIGDVDLVAENIKKGVDIFGVVGTMQGGGDDRSKSFDVARRLPRYTYMPSSTYTFDAQETSDAYKYLPTNDRCYVVGGKRYHGAVLYNKVSNEDSLFCTISDASETGITINSGRTTDLFILLPYRLKAGETFAISYHRGTTNRGVHIVCDLQGRYITHENASEPGAGDTAWSYTATQDCWLYYGLGAYDAYSSLVITNAAVSIS